MNTALRLPAGALASVTRLHPPSVPPESAAPGEAQAVWAPGANSGAHALLASERADALAWPRPAVLLPVVFGCGVVLALAGALAGLWQQGQATRQLTRLEAAETALTAQAGAPNGDALNSQSRMVRSATLQRAAEAARQPARFPLPRHITAEAWQILLAARAPVLAAAASRSLVGDQAGGPSLAVGVGVGGDGGAAALLRSGIRSKASGGRLRLSGAESRPRRAPLRHAATRRAMASPASPAVAPLLAPLPPLQAKPVANWSVYVPIASAGDPGVAQESLLASGAPQADASLPALAASVTSADLAGTPAQEEERQLSEDPRTRVCQRLKGWQHPEETCRVQKSFDDAGVAYDDCVREIEIAVAQCIARRN